MWSLRQYAMTSSPTVNRVTAGPTATTSPAASQPGISGRWCGKPPWSLPARILQSTGLTPAARTLITTRSGPVVGSGRSCRASTPGSPNSVSAIAFTVASLFNAPPAGRARQDDPMGYREEYQRSIADPESFWLAAATAVDWTRPPNRILDSDRAPFYRWFPDAELNTCHNALDRHVDAGHGDRPALIHDSPVTGSVRTYSYRELRDGVAGFAGVLRALGVARGDRVVISLPMIPEAVIAMLACARLGAIHSV